LALFEIKKDEVVSDLINLSGGASSNTTRVNYLLKDLMIFHKK
jgi:hypothetical protein